MRRTPHPMRLAFMGTPDFAVPALRALYDAGHHIVAVYTQPPKAAGRGMQLRKTPVHILADHLGLVVRTPHTLRNLGEQEAFKSFDLDVAIVCAYGLILPQAILDMPRHGCINIHGSLLPRWRGAAPIQRAIEAGDSVTGITIMQMEAGLDTGPMLMKRSVAITEQTTGQELHDALTQVGADLILDALNDLACGKGEVVVQCAETATYAKKLSRVDGRIDWTQSASDVQRKVRAFIPWPGSFFLLRGEPVKVLAVEATSLEGGAPGTILDDRLTVACGTRSVRVLLVQRPGKKPTDGASFLRGAHLNVGTRL